MSDSQIKASLAAPPLEATSSEAAGQPISELNESIVLAYFQSFNQADFQTTAKLFAEAGQLKPPFESPIVGPEAIATYLETEAKGMRAIPKTFRTNNLSTGTEVEVLGKVQTPLFSVNICWQFDLNAESEIRAVTIKLLAALPDLLVIKKNKEET